MVGKETKVTSAIKCIDEQKAENAPKSENSEEANIIAQDGGELKEVVVPENKNSESEKTVADSQDKEKQKEIVVFDLKQARASKFSSNDLDNDIKRQSEESYIKIVKDIVSATIEQLDEQKSNKKGIRKILLIFFVVFLSVQYVTLFALLIMKGFVADFGVGDSIMLTFITSVFVETLGAVIIMVKFAFDSKQENAALKILHGVIRRYKKFGDKSDNKEE